MDTVSKTKKIMTKDQVVLFVDLVNSNPIINSKETNATTNKLKEECWTVLTNLYNSKSGQTPRNKDQLKLKWDNLKKAARKRAANIRLNNLKPDSLPPDEILDKVASVLGSTCNGFDVSFGGDGTGSFEAVDVDYCDDEAQVIFLDESLLPPTKRKRFDLNPPHRPSAESDENEGPMHLYDLKMKDRNQDDGRLQLNLAMAKYYEKKAEKIDLEIELLKIELANKVNKCKIAKTENNDSI